MFGNQWFRTMGGKWVEAEEAVFTYDETARKQVRLDYRGGYDKRHNAFFLQNCGFFNQSTDFNSKFVRKKENNPLQIDFEQLEKL